VYPRHDGPVRTGLTVDEHDGIEESGPDSLSDRLVDAWRDAETAFVEAAGD